MTEKKIIPFSRETGLTTETLRSFPGCEQLSDEDALNAVQTIEKLAVILFDLVCRKNGIVIDNQLVISKNEQKDTLNKAA